MFTKLLMWKKMQMAGNECRLMCACKHMPRSSNPRLRLPPSTGILPTGCCPSVPWSPCRRTGRLRLRAGPGPQESPATGGNGGSCHEVASAR